MALYSRFTYKQSATNACKNPRLRNNVVNGQIATSSKMYYTFNTNRNQIRTLIRSLQSPLSSFSCICLQKIQISQLSLTTRGGVALIFLKSLHSRIKTLNLHNQLMTLMHTGRLSLFLHFKNNSVKHTKIHSKKHRKYIEKYTEDTQQNMPLSH